MSFADAQAAVTAIADRIAASSGFEVVEVEVRGGAGKGGRMVRVFIERSADGGKKLADELAASAENGLKLPSHVPLDQLAERTYDDLQSFSRERTPILDVEDALPRSA